MGRECVEGGVEDRGQVKLSMVRRRNRDPSLACFTTHNPKNQEELAKADSRALWFGLDLIFVKIVSKQSQKTVEFEGDLIPIQRLSACV